MATLTLAAALLTTAAVDPLAYGARDGRWEGVRSGPVSGYDVELLGAMVESEQATAAVPDELAVLFFLEDREDVYLTVRERDPLEYYWLDRVVPPKGWRGRTVNQFAWPSGDVLRPLGLAPSELVALARLGRDTPARRERVAPVVFPAVLRPQTVSRYRFVFKTNGAAMLRHSVYGPGSDAPLLASEAHTRRAGGAPFDVRWDAGGAPEGRYRVGGLLRQQQRPGRPGGGVLPRVLLAGLKAQLLVGRALPTIRGNAAVLEGG
jgi:hypothetical protein